MTKRAAKETRQVLKHLAVADARLAAIIKSVGAYEIKLRKDPFQSLVEAIIYQQLAGSGADAIYGRVVKIYGRVVQIYRRVSTTAQTEATQEVKMGAPGASPRKI